MDDPPSVVTPVAEASPPPRLRAPTILIVTAALIAATVVYQGYHAWIAFDPDDTNHLETPLVLAVARQIVDGPSTLYGPFSGSHPLVLIHAPLYYRLAGLCAWPMVRGGVDPITASLIAGRTLSFVGMLALLASAAIIASIDGRRGLVSAWTALLIASSPVFGSFPVTVRPDTLGVAFQTIGFGLILRALIPRNEGGAAFSCRVPAAGIAFGFAACAKQHLLVAAGCAFVFLLLGSIRGRIRLVAVVAFLFACALVPMAYYGWEQYVTHGRMSESVVSLPSQLRRLAPASWSHVGTVFWGVAKLAIGFLALALSVLLVSPRRALGGTRLDGLLWTVLLAEVAAMVPLCLGSNGAWVNYAMPAVVWAAILLARALMRVLDGPRLGLKTLSIWAAVAILGFNDVRLAATSYTARRDGRELLSQVLADATVSRTPPNQRYFVAMPQYNRLYGRVDLAHDEWLFASYETAGMAEPRSRWLLEALTERPAGASARPAVTVVIVPSDERRGDFVHGLDVRLPSLGYHNIQQYGRFAVWTRGPRAKD